MVAKEEVGYGMNAMGVETKRYKLPSYKISKSQGSNVHHIGNIVSNIIITLYGDRQ